MDDRGTPSLVPARVQGDHHHLVLPQSAGNGSETSSSGVSHRTVQSVEQEMLREADQQRDMHQYGALPVTVQLSQVKTQAMLDQHQKEWDQKRKELDQTKK